MRKTFEANQAEIQYMNSVQRSLAIKMHWLEGKSTSI